MVAMLIGMEENSAAFTSVRLTLVQSDPEYPPSTRACFCLSTLRFFKLAIKGLGAT